MRSLSHAIFITFARDYRRGVSRRRYGYLTALAKTDLSGHLDYTDRNIVEKLFQTFTMRIGRFHETWNGSQPSAERWLIAYTYYDNHHRSHQGLDNQPTVEAAELS